MESLSVDMDDVLLPFVPNFLKFYNKRNGTDFQVKDLFCFDFSKIFGIPASEDRKQVHAFLESDEIMELEPFEDSVEAVNNLKEDYNLYVVTSRQNFIIERTHSWLDKHFKNCFKDVLFGNYEGKSGRSYSKAELCKRVGVKLHVDDSLDSLVKCSQEGIQPVLFDRDGEYVWNHKPEPEKVMRVYNWDEAKKHIKEKI